MPQPFWSPKQGRVYLSCHQYPLTLPPLGWEKNTALFPRWPWKQKSLLSAKVAAWSWYSSNDLKILFLWSSFTKIAHSHSTMRQQLSRPAQGTSFLCPSSLILLYHGIEFCAYPKYQQSCFPSKGRRSSTSFTGRFCPTVQCDSDHSVSLLCLHNFLLFSGTVRATEISMTYSSCPHAGTKIPKGKHKIILLQGCMKRSK